jgi:hypothetical protein
MLAGETTGTVQGNVFLPKARIESIRDDLNALLPSLGTLAATIGDAAISVDDALSQFVTTIGRVAAYRLPQTVVGFALEWRAAAYASLMARIADRVKTWNERLARY